MERYTPEQIHHEIATEVRDDKLRKAVALALSKASKERAALLIVITVVLIALLGTGVSVAGSQNSEPIILDPVITTEECATKLWAQNLGSESATHTPTRTPTGTPTSCRVYLPMVLKNYNPFPVTSTTIDPGEGGELTSPDGRVQLDFPPDAVSESTVVTYTRRTAPSQSTGGLVFAGTSFEISATDTSGNPVSNFSRTFNMTVAYADNNWQSAGIANETTLNVYWWDGTAWNGLLPCTGCSHDTDSNEFVISLDHLTEFALQGQIHSENATQVRDDKSRRSFVHLVDQPQPLEGNPRIHELDDVGLLGHDLGQTAGGDDLHLRAQLLPETGHHAFYQAHVAK